MGRRPEEDLALDPAIDPRALPVADGSPPARVLLTGATGFLGLWLLRALLAHTSATILCLVRGEDDAGAYARLRAAGRRFGVWDEALAPRIVAVAGDLTRPHFGLSDARWEGLAVDADTIVHNGALVSFVQPYAALAPANVDGTTEVLRLATTTRVKTVHYVSTLGVVGDAWPCPHTTAALAPMACPPADDHLLARYLGWLEGARPAPQGAP